VSTGASVVVIGLGNEYCRDDGVGPYLVDLLSAEPPPGVALVHTAGDPATLIDAWDGACLAIVVDALQLPEPEPGRIHRVSVEELCAHVIASTHGLGLVQAVQLGLALNRMAAELQTFGVEIADVSHGVGLTPAVADALPALRDAVVEELSRFMSAGTCNGADAAESITRGEQMSAPAQG